MIGFEIKRVQVYKSNGDKKEMLNGGGGGSCGVLRGSAIIKFRT